MNKKDISNRILQKGDALHLNGFEWDSENLIFSSNQCDLIIDFTDMHDITIKMGDHCTLTCGRRCIIEAGNNCIIDTQNSCKFNVGKTCIIKTCDNAIINSDSSCTIICREKCVIMPTDDLVLIRRDVSVRSMKISTRDKDFIRTVESPIETLQGGSYETIDRAKVMVDGIEYWIDDVQLIDIRRIIEK